VSWKGVKLENLFKVGSSRRVLKSQWQTSGVPFYRGREITRLAIHGSVDNELFISEDLLSELKQKFGVPADGDIVITAIGTIGNAYVVRPKDRFYFKDASVLWLAKRSEIDSDFVNYWLQSPQFKCQLAKGNGATVDTLTITKLKSAEILVPPNSEQKRIVAILDEAFAGIETAIANTEKNLANAHELFLGFLKRAFDVKQHGWKESVVGDFSEHCLGKMLDKRKNKGVLRPYLRNVNVRWFDVDTSDLLEMKIEDDEVDRYRVQRGDLLICEGGYPGRAAIWEYDEPMFFQKAVHRVCCHDTAHSRWLMYFLYLADATGYLREYFTGAGIQHFTGKSLKRFLVPLAPPDQATKLTARMDELRADLARIESTQNRKLAALRELKQSLLQKAFSGELTADSAEREMMEQSA